MSALVKRTENGKADIFDTIFGDVFRPIEQSWTPTLWYSKNHASDIFKTTETDSEFTIKVTAPGLKKDDFKISLEGKSLTISFEIKKEQENILTEGKYYRTYTLGDNVKMNNIEATYDAGILSVVLKKQEPKTIPVKTIVVK